MRRYIHRALAGVLAGAVLFGGITSLAFADTAPADIDNGTSQNSETLWDDKGFIKAGNQADLETLVTQAQEAGVQVNTIEQTLDPTTDTNAESAKTAIEANNRTSITELNAAMQQQEAYNTKFKEDITSAVNTMFGGVWDASSLQLTDEQLANLAVITPAGSAEHPFSLNQDGKDLNNKNQVAVGDSWSYSNVLEDPKSGSWVDLKLTLVKAWDTSRIENPNPPEVNEVRLSGSKLGTGEVSMYTGDFDVQVNVEFLEHGTNTPVSLTPMLIYTDVDEKQAVRIDSGGGDYLRLMGSRVQEVTDQSSRQFGASANLRGGSADNSKPVREYWAIFMLQETSSFTYTFFDGPGTDVLHGIGSGALDFNRPTDKDHAQADVTLYKQAVKHSLDYKVVGAVPEKSSAVPTPQEYEHNADVAIADGLTTDSDVKDGVDGTWSFKGWFTDETLTNPAANFAIAQDTTLYGGWDFKPNTYRVTHEFKSGTDGMELPEAVAERAPEDVVDLVTGTHVKPGEFDHSDYADTVNDGVWSFQSWDRDELTIDRADDSFVGTWVFTANPKPVPPTPVNNAEPKIPSKSQLAKTGAASSWAMYVGAVLATLGVAVLGLRKKLEK